MFGAAKITKMPKCSYLGFCIGLNYRLLFLPSSFDCDKNAILGVDNGSSMHTGNGKNNILVLGPTQALDHTAITVKVEFSINFSSSKRRFCLGLSYNENNRFSFINTTQIYQFKIKPYVLCLVNISKDFIAKYMK